MSTTLRVLLATALLGAAAFCFSSPSSQAGVPAAFDSASVRLYSDGKLVGEWEAVGEGRVEGQTLVFPVAAGVRQLEVRISGTWSFEPKP